MYRLCALRSASAASHNFSATVSIASLFSLGICGNPIRVFCPPFRPTFVGQFPVDPFLDVRLRLEWFCVFIRTPFAHARTVIVGVVRSVLFAKEKTAVLHWVAATSVGDSSVNFLCAPRMVAQARNAVALVAPIMLIASVSHSVAPLSLVDRHRAKQRAIPVYVCPLEIFSRFSFVFKNRNPHFRVLEHNDKLARVPL
jgi:hypothetical protein